MMLKNIAIAVGASLLISTPVFTCGYVEVGCLVWVISLAAGCLISLSFISNCKPEPRKVSVMQLIRKFVFAVGVGLLVSTPVFACGFNEAACAVWVAFMTVGCMITIIKCPHCDKFLCED